MSHNNRKSVKLAKVNWSGYTTYVDILIDEVDPTAENYDRFVEAKRVRSRKHIPMGCRRHYIPGLSEESKSLYEAYKKQYMSNPFDSTTLDTGNQLISKMAAENKRRWEEMITSTDLTGNSRKAWQTIRKISNDLIAPKPPCLVTANQIAHQLLVNSRGEMSTKLKCFQLSPVSGDDSSRVFPFTEETGCLQPTNVENLYLLAGIAPPAVRRSVTAQREREKQVNDNRHPLHGHSLPRKRLKSRNSFIYATDELIQSQSIRRLEQWSQHLQSVPHRLPQTPSECLASGASGTWNEWRCLNRLRTKMGRCKHNLRKWNYTDEDDTTCECKEADQTMEHLLECPLLRQTCSLDNLMVYNAVAEQCVRQWIGLV